MDRRTFLKSSVALLALPFLPLPEGAATVVLERSAEYALLAKNFVYRTTLDPYKMAWLVGLHGRLQNGKLYFAGEYCDEKEDIDRTIQILEPAMYRRYESIANGN